MNSLLRLTTQLLILAVSIAFIGCSGSKRAFEIPGPAIDLTDSINRQELRELVTSKDLQLATFDEQYYLGPGDLINIQLVGRPDVFSSADGNGTEIRLTNNPAITLPLIGSIRVHGKTAAELTADLKQAYGVYIVNPEPIVLISEFNRNQIAVLGSVDVAGKYPFEFGDTAIDGLFKAGGLSTGGRGGGTAPGRFMKIYREKITPDQKYRLSLDEVIQLILSDGKVVPREEITIPISDFIFDGVLEYNIPLKQNDIIYVPPAGTVMVQGRVNSPGVVFLGPSIQTVTQCVVERGGLRFSAADRIEVLRTLPDGQTTSYFLNIRGMVTRQTEDFVIKDGDQIFVHPNTWRAVAEAVSQLFQGSVRAGANATYSPAG